MAELIEMSFGTLSWVDPGNHVLDGVQIPHVKGSSWGEGHMSPTCPTALWREHCKNSLTYRDAVWVTDSGGSNEACIRCDPDPQCKRAIIRGKDMLGQARQQSAMSCTKMAELIDLSFDLWTRVGWRKHKFNHIRQVVPVWRNGSLGGHICSTWRIRLNAVAAVRPYVKLLWPLVI